MTTQPLIAITAGEVYNENETWFPVTHGQSHTYVEAVEKGGGTPYIFPLVHDQKALRQLYELSDGILFAGGDDPDPLLYGAAPIPQLGHVSKRRDAQELQLLKWAIADNKPMLLICRGMQLLNILQGGTLYQDIPTELPDKEDHNSSTKAKSLEHFAHTLKVVAGTQFAEIIGQPTIRTNTHHHMAIKDLGKHLRVNSYAADGIIEGLELTNHPFAIGVQSHPESLLRAEPDWQKYFAAFCQAAAQR